METSSGGPVLVVGAFSLTGSPVCDHCAATLTALAGAGLDVRAISPLPGAFAEADLRAVLASDPHPDTVILYLKPLLTAPRGTGLSGVISQLRRARRLARCARRTLLVTGGSGIIEYVASRFLAGGTTRRTPLALPPHIALSRVLGLDLPASDVGAARQASFDLIAARSATVLRLTPAHVRAAAEGLPPADPLRRTLRDLGPLFASLIPGEARRAAASGMRMAQSRAAQHALSPAPGQRVPRIVQHLRQLGARPQRWRGYLPQPTLNDTGPDRRVAAVLRYLARTPRPSDAMVLADLSTPLGHGIAGTRLDFLTHVALRPEVRDAATLERPWMSVAYRDWVARGSGGDADAATLNLVGLAAPRTGLAQNLAMSRDALDMAGLPYRITRIGIGPGGAQPARKVLRMPVTRPAVLWHLNADRIPAELVERFGERDACHIGFLLWELDRLPRAHRLALEMLDEIWVPSEFLRKTYATAFDGPVINVKKGIALPEPSVARRPDTAGPVFVTAFDIHSSAARKNPLVAVEAFREAFRPGREASLIIKSTPDPGTHWGDPEGQMARIRAIAGEDPRIRLIEEHLPFRDFLGLISGADALVSSHRAEGFGYVPAYALALGVPVIATDWSGTQDFLTPRTAFPVACEKVPVPEGHAILPTPGARWAEVDREALARAMREVADNPPAARARALRGRHLIATEYSMEAQAERYIARFRELGLVHPDPLEAARAS